MRKLIATLLLAASLPATASDDACRGAAPDTFVPGESQCLTMRLFGTSTPRTLVVWLHGDVSSGGPANYHFAAARTFAEEQAAADVLSVALVRPGYPDGDGNASSVAFLQAGRQDHYTRQNVSEVAGAIQRLKTRFRPARTLVVGHSGGAATAAVLLGLAPDLLDGAVLVACPCELNAWRLGRRPWTASENPFDWAARTPLGARVHALTGTLDDNTAPRLAQIYVATLQQRGIDAKFESIENATHNGAFRAPEVMRAVAHMLQTGPAAGTNLR